MFTSSRAHVWPQNNKKKLLNEGLLGVSHEPCKRHGKSSYVRIIAMEDFILTFTRLPHQKKEITYYLKLSFNA